MGTGYILLGEGEGGGGGGAILLGLLCATETGNKLQPCGPLARVHLIALPSIYR